MGLTSSPDCKSRDSDSHPADLGGRSGELRFTVRRPPTGEVSPCGHRPSGGDVARGVDVGVAPSGSAGFALEDRLALAVSGCDVPARGASLRRVRGRDLLDPPERFVLQTCDQLAPATSADHAVEPTFLGDSDARLLVGAMRGADHRPQAEILDPDHVEPSCEVGGGLLDPVLTPVPVAGFQFRDRPFCLLSAVGAARATGQPLLQHLQPFRLTGAKTGDAQQFAGRQRSGHHNTAVYADHAAVPWTGYRVGDMRERDMPASSPIPRNPVGPDALWHRSRPAEPHPSDLGHPDPTQAAVEALDVMRFHRDLPKPLVHTGFTPRRAPVCAGEQVPHRLSEIPQRLLLYCLTSRPKPRVLGACLRQLRALLQIARSPAAWPPVLLLLHRQIPHIPRIPAVRQQSLLLLRGGQQPKSGHIRTVSATTDIPRTWHASTRRDRLPPWTEIHFSQPKEIQ
jgi:hypothetical protein